MASAAAAALGLGVPQLYAKGETPRVGRILDPTKGRGSLRHVAPAQALLQQAAPSPLTLALALARTPAPSPSPSPNPNPGPTPKPGRAAAFTALGRLLPAAGGASARAGGGGRAALDPTGVRRRAP